MRPSRHTARGGQRPGERAGLPPAWTAAGVIEVLEPLAGTARIARLERHVSERIGSVTLLMDAPNDPHNAGAAVRSCDAFGVAELHVVPRDKPVELGRSVTSGADRWVEVVLHETPEAAVAALGSRGFELVATHPEGELVPEDLARIERVCLVMGNEHDGIREALRSAASRSVRIPMRGFVESLNLSVAAAILLRAATSGRHGDLDPGERRELYARGLTRSVPRAEDILAASAPR